MKNHKSNLNKNTDHSLVPIQNTGIAKVEKSIQITNNIIFNGIDKLFNEAFLLLNSCLELDDNINYCFNFEYDKDYLKKNIFEFTFDSVSYDDIKKAIELFNKILILSPKHKYSLSFRAFAYLKLYQYSEAIRDFNDSIKINSDCAFDFYNRANAKNNLNDFDGAIADCNIAIEKDPTEQYAYRFRGDAKRKKRDFLNALADYNFAFQLDPNNWDFAYQLYLLKRFYMKDYKGAINECTKLIDLSENKLLPYEWRGELKYECGDYLGAIDDFTKVIEISPRADTFKNRSKAKVKINDLQGATEDLNEYEKEKHSLEQFLKTKYQNANRSHF